MNIWVTASADSDALIPTPVTAPFPLPPTAPVDDDDKDSTHPTSSWPSKHHSFPAK